MLSAVARWVITAQDPPIPVLALVQLTHGLSFGLTQVGIMNLMVNHVPPHIMARGQGYLSACSGIAAGSAGQMNKAIRALEMWLEPLPGSGVADGSSRRQLLLQCGQLGVNGGQLGPFGQRFPPDPATIQVGVEPLDGEQRLEVGRGELRQRQ